MVIATDEVFRYLAEQDIRHAEGITIPPDLLNTLRSVPKPRQGTEVSSYDLVANLAREKPEIYRPLFTFFTGIRDEQGAVGRLEATGQGVAAASPPFSAALIWIPLILQMPEGKFYATIINSLFRERGMSGLRPPLKRCAAEPPFWDSSTKIMLTTLLRW